MKLYLRFKSIVHSDTKIHLSKSPLKGRAWSFRMGFFGGGGAFTSSITSAAWSVQEYADGYAKHGAVRSGWDANVEKNHITPTT